MQKFTLKLLILAFLLTLPKTLLGIESLSKTALIMDLSTGEVLLEKNSEERTYPSSMTKIMTVLVAFEKIKNGTLAIDHEFLISKKAWKMG